MPLVPWGMIHISISDGVPGYDQLPVENRLNLFGVFSNIEGSVVVG